VVEFAAVAKFGYIYTIQTTMRKPKLYVNGMEEQIGQMKEAREILQRRGIYRTLGNFGPLFPDKLEYRFNHIETFTLEGYEYMIVEREVMGFSLESMAVSEPFVERVAWFQPIKRQTNN